MRRPDEQLARALVRLNAAEEFRLYRDWLADSLAATDIELRQASGDALLRLQGEAQCLADQIKRIDGARDLADTLAQSSRIG